MHSVTRVAMSGFAARKSALNLDRRALELDREGQERRKDSIVPMPCGHCPSSSTGAAYTVHIPSLLEGTQWPDRASTLYLPERSLVWLTAFFVSHGEDPHVQKIGWHLVRPMKAVLRYFRDVRLSALSLSLPSQYFRTAALTMDLALSLDGGDVSHSDGWGRPY